MNKFAAIALFAMMAGVVSAGTGLIDLEDPETQMSLTPSDSDETAALVGDATLFADFCIKSRDYVMGDIKQQTNSLAATIFHTFFSSAAEIGQNALDVEKYATGKLGNQIRDPNAAIDSQSAANQAEMMIVDGQMKIQQGQVQPRTFLQAVVSTIGATGNAVATGVVNKLNSLTGYFGLNKVGSALSGVCNQIAHYEDQNRAAFAEFVKTIAAKDANLGNTPFENVACLTSRRISRLDGVCKFSAVAQAPVSKIIKSVQ